jgi:hypothetical protein
MSAVPPTRYYLQEDGGARVSSGFSLSGAAAATAASHSFGITHQWLEIVVADGSIFVF